MPLYEYECEKCGEHFERMQKFSDEPLTTHEKCGGQVHRLLSAPALQFKGSGWYITDYAKGGSAKSEKSEKPAGNGSEKKSDKPAGASESSTTASTDTKASTKPASDTK